MMNLAAFAVLLAQASPGTWDPPAPPTVPPAGLGISMALFENTRLFVVSGDNSPAFHEYNVRTGLWTRRADLPVAAAQGCCSAIAGGKFWVLPGGGLKDFLVFDPASNLWTGPLPASFPVKVRYGGMTAIGDVLYALGGLQFDSGVRSDLFYSCDTKASSLSWKELPIVPMSGYWHGTAIAAVGADIYVTFGGDNPLFWRYSDGAWSERLGITFDPTVPISPFEDPLFPFAGRGAALASDGERLIWYSGDPGSSATSETVPIHALGDRAVGAMEGSEYEYFRDSALLARAPWSARSSSSNPYSTGIAFASDTRQLYLLRGANTIDFAVVDLAVSPPRLVEPLPLVGDSDPVAVADGGALVGADQVLYSMPGNNTTSFFRLDLKVSSTRWTEMARLPGAIGGTGTGPKDGGALAYDGTRYFYAVGNDSNFYRFDSSLPGAGAWTTLAAFPASNGARLGSQLVHVAENPLLGISEALYLLPADGSTAFLKFSVATGLWSQVAGTPQSTAEGSAAAHPAGSRYIFVLQGSTNISFWAYDVVANRWNVTGRGSTEGFDPADLPVPPAGRVPIAAPGTALLHPASGPFLYALIAGYRDDGYHTYAASDLWTYQLPGTGEGSDTWVRRESGVNTWGRGASIAYPGSGPWIYVQPGNGSARVLRYRLPNSAPSIVDFGQVRVDGSTPVRAGGSNFEGAWQVRVAAEDPDGDILQATVEYGPPGGPWESVSRSFPAGLEPSLLMVTPPAGAYEWRLTVTDRRGASAGTRDFGDAAGAIDIRLRSTDALPDAVPLVKDRYSDRVIPPGGTVPFDTFAVRIAALIEDPDELGDRARIDAEILHPETGEILFAASGDFAAPGEESSAPFTIKEVGSYPVRYRYTDEWGYTGPWSALGGDGADFQVLPNGSAGTGKVCGASAGLLPLWPALLLSSLLRPRRGVPPRAGRASRAARA